MGNHIYMEKALSLTLYSLDDFTMRMLH